MSGVGDSFARLVVDGPFVVAALVAAVAGLVSFLSPCVLPLVPGHLSYVGGLSGTEANAATDGTTAGGGVATRTRVRSRTVLGAMLFVLGFTAVSSRTACCSDGSARRSSSTSDCSSASWASS